MSAYPSNQEPEKPCFIQAPELTGDEDWLDTGWDGHVHEGLVPWAVAMPIIFLRALPYAEYLQTTHWYWIRRRAMAKSNWQCVACNKDAVDAHHVTYKRKGFERIEDVVGLCRGCHQTWTNTWSLQAKESLR